MPSIGAPRPLVLIRGFGGTDVSDEQRNAYQGFNDGTVYPGRRGDNFIYEGLVLRCLKSSLYRYTDATNVAGYYAHGIGAPQDLGGFDPDDVSGSVALDPATANRVLSEAGPGTIWVYRYYDLDPRSLVNYGQQLKRLIALIEKTMERQGHSFDGVDVVAHSMGGLVAREALRAMYEDGDSARRMVHRVVTLGTPHRGIAFQRLPSWLLRALPGVKKAEDELAAFDPTKTEFLQIGKWFDVDRILTVVGTNSRSYNVQVASLANRISSLFDEGTLSTNRSDGLVKHSAAQLPGAPRTFVDKCHGGPDSLVTSREAYEIAMRFFHGTHHVRLWLDDAEITRGMDIFGKSEFYLGVSVKPRGTDFDLFHQSKDAENCYGPFSRSDLNDEVPDLKTQLEKAFADAGDATTWWAGPDRLIWEGWVDANNLRNPDAGDLVFRLDIYLGERDTFGVGFSDNVIFHKQYFVQAITGSPLAVLVHTDERSLREDPDRDLKAAIVRASVATPESKSSPRVQKAQPSTDGDTFLVQGTGFTATFRFAIDES